ncbi:hypothetical protein UFOVP826_67 [uncultured Caudovirales phage]|uniref:Uncharacterized protein n=1 Tax=uncultured Caudovirales phage TaxID=2100421 RepID=A0A6J5P056_9CAUD|nr:hypothetical protein UFOVP826_67 [uncultured Caudovirales phage]
MLNLFALIGAMAYRWRGSGDPLSATFRRFVCAALLMVPIYSQANWIELTIVSALTLVGFAVGHGRYFSLGRGPYPERGDNWPGVITSFLLPRISRTLHDWIAMSITGLASSVFVAAFMAWNGLYWQAGVMVLAGLIKPLAYEVGYRLPSRWTGTNPIGLCELLNGAALGCAVWLVYGG